MSSYKNYYTREEALIIPILLLRFGKHYCFDHTPRGERAPRHSPTLLIGFSHRLFFYYLSFFFFWLQLPESTQFLPSLPFSIYNVNGAESHQVVATKEDPRAISARGRPHSLTAGQQDGAQYKTGPQEQSTLAAGTLSFRNTREARPREGKHVNRWTARPEGQAE
jgi:hypothetical protein